MCEHYDKTPGRITEEELRDYFLYGKNVKKWARSTSTVALCGIKFFYENTIKRPWPTLLFIRPGHEKKLPVVLSRDEVRETLRNIQLLRYRACLTTIYACGLRLSEGIHLKVENIDSARGILQVRKTKGHMGHKDRDVPLPQKTLQLLREQWKSHKNKVWIFPSAGQGGKTLHLASLRTGIRVWAMDTDRSRLQRLLPDTVILDIRLPDDSGIQLLRQIKSGYPGIKVIMLTNYDLQQYRRQCLRLGADYFLNKTQEFEKMVPAVLGRPDD